MTCANANAKCVYQDLPTSRTEESTPAALVDRLGRIEALLEQQSQQIYQLNIRLGHSSSFADQLGHGSEKLGAIVRSHSVFNPSLEMSPFLIPQNHTALAGALLAIPQLREAIGDYPRDCFMRAEEKLPLPRLLDRLHDGPLVWPALDPHTVSTLATCYFQLVHPHQPLFTPRMFESWQKTLLETQNPDSIVTAICLCVYSLGALLSPQHSHQKATETLGLEYFQPAFRIIIREVLWGFRPEILACQALLLAASYFAHLGRPLHSLRMGYFASMLFLNIAESRHNNSKYAELDDAEVRVYWQCFMVECDGVAELDILRSGIEPLGDTMPLPQSLELADTGNHIYSIAEHAIRRLLNRIISALYDPDSAPQYMTLSSNPVHAWQRFGLPKLLSLSAELDRQLEQWYSSIPGYLRFPKGTDFLPNDRSRVLRTRYYMARHLIYRPFMLQAILGQWEGSPLPETSFAGSDPFDLPVTTVKERCRMCIDSCSAYLHNAINMIDKRSPYLWVFSQNCIATIVLLWLAENSAPISHLVPAMRPVHITVLDNLRRWATEDSGFDTAVRILEQLTFLDHL